MILTDLLPRYVLAFAVAKLHSVVLQLVQSLSLSSRFFLSPFSLLFLPLPALSPSPSPSHSSVLRGRIEGLKAVVITDAEGVSLIKVTAGDEEDAAVESVITPSFLVTATAAAEQSCKLGTGANTSAIIAFEKFQVVHTVASPLMIHLVSAAGTNTGLLLDMARDLKRTIAPLQAKMAAEAQ